MPSTTTRRRPTCPPLRRPPARRTRRRFVIAGSTGPTRVRRGGPSVLSVRYVAGGALCRSLASTAPRGREILRVGSVCALGCRCLASAPVLRCRPKFSWLDGPLPARSPAPRGRLAELVRHLWESSAASIRARSALAAHGAPAGTSHADGDLSPTASTASAGSERPMSDHKLGDLEPPRVEAPQI